MLYKNGVVTDIETDGLWATKIHCLCYRRLGSDEVVALRTYDQIIAFLSEPDLTIIGHNFIQYDRPSLERVLGMKFNYRVADTLGLSWILEPTSKKHGLAEYGEIFGVPKPKIDDWENLTQEEYVHRCTEDVKINYKLWFQQYSYLYKLYDGNTVKINNFIKYIELKLTCVAEQDTRGVRADIPKIHKMIEFLTKEKENKIKALEAVMPKKKVYGEKEQPKVMYKKDGSVSANGQKWFDFLDAHGLPRDHSEPVTFLTGFEEPNAESTPQKKEWLYSLGWEPMWYKYNKNKKTGVQSKVEQIKNKDAEKQGEVCDSVKMLFEKEPNLAMLEGLGIVSHRLSVFKKFLTDMKNGGRLYQGMAGFTNTMRLKHTVIVNLPKVSIMYGKEIRSVLIADEGMLLCGSDLSNIESQTRNHYVFPYDPEYVRDMTAYGFDSHTDIAVLAGFISRHEEEFFKWAKDKSGAYKIDEKHFGTGKKGVVSQLTLEELIALEGDAKYAIIDKISKERGKGKTVNFAAVYGVGAPTLSRNSGLSELLCTQLLEVYWGRNWSVRTVAERTMVKEVNGQLWLYNPVSGFWYSLRADKDRFSTLNQSTAVYVFDVWMSFMRKLGLKSIIQVHDETLMTLHPEEKEEVSEKIQQAMDNVNAFLKLNVTVACESKFGTDYAAVH